RNDLRSCVSAPSLSIDVVDESGEGVLDIQASGNSHSVPVQISHHLVFTLHMKDLHISGRITAISLLHEWAEVRLNQADPFFELSISDNGNSEVAC
ncbi:hypothetical protein PENTCL1PPCAC_27284, partial [Pristionchus entomophagus]